MKKIIANKIAELFKLHDYDLTSIKVKKITDVIYNMNPSVTEKSINEFFNFVWQGHFGTLYRTPTSLTNMYYQYRRDNWKPPTPVRIDYGKPNPKAVPLDPERKKRIFKSIDNIGKNENKKK